MEEKQVTNQPTATRVSSQLRSFGNCSYLGFQGYEIIVENDATVSWNSLAN